MSAIDYDLTKIRGIALDVDGVLSTSTIPLSPQGEPLRMVSTKDGYALQLAVKKGLHIAVITGGNTESVRVRFASLGIKEIHLAAAHKLPVMLDWMARYGLKPEEVAYMGDDIPDLMCMRNVGLPCAPHDACWEAKETAHYISRFDGGYGCVRDLVEQILKAQKLWLNDADSFGW